MTDAPKPTLTEAESEGLIAAIQDGTQDAYVARIKAAARREAIEDVAAVMDLSYEYVADLVERQAGR